MDPIQDSEELGVVIRTDFSNEEAWSAFCQKVQTAQKELMSDITNGDPNADHEGTSTDVAMQEVSEQAGNVNDEESDESSDEGMISDIIKFINPTEEAERAQLTNISNITALRLFNDTDIRQAPSPGPNVKRISPPHPLIDQNGWQEIYTGKNLWVFDARSNNDGCVRVVSQTGDFYGTAT